jgi:hypothetical protein
LGTLVDHVAGRDQHRFTGSPLHLFRVPLVLRDDLRRQQHLEQPIVVPVHVADGVDVFRRVDLDDCGMPLPVPLRSAHLTG